MAGNRDEWIFQTVEDCENYINEVGFLPLFASEEFPGGSVQERTKPWVWWTGNEKSDPWLWREQIAARGKIAYGKFFHGRAGFVSREWFPYLANYRRFGYDYDSRWDEGLATNRSRKEMAPWLRTLLCAALNTLIYEVINVAYLYIDGTMPTFAHIFKAFLDVVLTGALTLLVMLPVRWLIFGRRHNAPVMRTAPVVFTKH